MRYPNNVRKCATHGLVLTGSRFFCDAEFDDCEPVGVHVHTDDELRARDERIIRAAFNAFDSWLYRAEEPSDFDAIIAAAEADQ